MSELLNYQYDMYSVTRLNREARVLLENGMATLWVQGELSNFVCPSSGHMYFSLKDASAQVRCTMFSNKNRLLGFTPVNGMGVTVQSKVSLYEVRGEFQLLVSHMELSGEGTLRRAYEALKAKLSAEGLFDAMHKKALPPVPKTIGIITSPTGAAVQDIINTLARRYPIANVIVYPVSVQGESAVTEIVEMLEIAESRAECDVLIVARGGGSMEDLSAFSDEPLARAVFSCALPIVSGIGHEIDFTIIDFVADERAATPTAAAELVSPEQQYTQQKIQQLLYRLIQTMNIQLMQLKIKVTDLQQCLPHPMRQLQNNMQQLDDLSSRLQSSMFSTLNARRSRLQMQEMIVYKCLPMQKLQLYQQQLQQLLQRLQQAREYIWKNSAAKLESLADTLNALSPLATLSRGYAIVRQCDVVVRDASQLSKADKVQVRFAKGQANCSVDEVFGDVVSESD